MADQSDSQKTEEPTPQKLRDSRKEGQVAQSRDITMSATLITSLLYLVCGYHGFLQMFNNNYAIIEAQIKNTKLDNRDIIEALFQIVRTNIPGLLAMVGMVAIISTLVNIVQTGGPVWASKSFKVDFNRLNPATNFKQLYSLKNLKKFIKDVVEISVFAILAIYLVSRSLRELLMMVNYSFTSVIAFICQVLFNILLWMLACYFIFAMFDFIIEKMAMHKQLMMSPDEIKQEFKNNEGNPEIKQARKELHRELVAEDGMSDTIKESSFVLANPTHIAIVIMYKPTKWPLPIILMKARANNAQIVFRVAKRFKVPIIRDKWFARGLYDIGEVGKFIPKTMMSKMATLINKNIDLLPQLQKDLIEIRKSAENMVGKV